MALKDWLRAAMRERGWNITRLAEQCDVSVQVASRWLMEDARKRITPSPTSCEKIALALGVSQDYVLELAGHRKPSEPADPEQPALRTPVRVRTEALERQFRRWMDVMGPRLGDDEAADLFWRPILSDAENRTELVVAALNTPAPTAPNTGARRPLTGVSPNAPPDDADLTNVYVPPTPHPLRSGRRVLADVA